MIPLTAAEDYPPLSALNDVLFCERRAFLHRVEGVWVENAHTLGGSLDHRRAHERKDSAAGGLRVARGLRVVSHALKVQGVCDLVEFPDDVPVPVEYKRGKRRKWSNDDVQLCAQGLALEEMLSMPVPAGAIYHVKSKRRREVVFSPALRAKTRQAAERLHALLAQSRAPQPVLHPKCKGCSLQRLCLPELLSSPASYLRAAAGLFAKPAE